MAAATSLIELILKKWGDDIAGAAKELEEKVGFPESVANRIATGELPMDEASRQARKAEQGYGDTYLHGGAEQITELDGGLLGSATGAKTAKQAFWSTKDPRTAGSYANHAAKDAPVRRKLEEANKAGDSGDWDRHDQLIDEAEALEKEVYNQPLQGQMITPITVKGPKAQMEARGRSFDDFGMSDEIGERIRGASHDGFSGVEISDLDDAVGLSNQPADHLATIDLESVRSPNAAFDPEYTGSNIMGNATVPMLATTAALAAAPAVVGGVFQHNATKEPVIKKRNNQSSLLESVTDFNDEVIESVKHAAGPLSLLMPYEGINDYLKVVNDYDRQPTWMDRLGLLDF